MNKFIIYKDGEKLNYIRQGFPIIDTLSEDVSTCQIIYKTRNDEISIPYETEIKIVDEVARKEYLFLVINDRVNTISSYPIIYEHTLTLANPKKYFAKLPVPAFTLTHTTNEEINTYTALHVLRRNYPLETEENWEKTRLFNIPEEWVSDRKFLLKAPQLFLNQTTVNDVIERLFKNVDYIYSVDNSNDTIPTLNYIDVNKKKSLITFEGFNTSKHTDSQNYAKTLQTQTSNAVIDEEEEQCRVYYPGKDVWSSTKIVDYTINGTRTNSTCQFITDRPIVKLLKLNILARMTVNLYVSLDDGTELNVMNTEIDVPIDISEYVYTRDQYNALYKRSTWDGLFKLPSSEYQNYALYYDYKGKVIYNGGTKERGNTNVSWACGKEFDKIEKILVKDVVYKKYNEVTFQYEDVHLGNLVFFRGDIAKEGQNKFVRDSASIVGEDMADYSYNVEYITENDVIVNQKRIDESGFNVETYLQVNQSENVPNIHSLGRNMMGMINRIGLNQVVWQNRAKSLSQVPQLGDYSSDNYVVVQREIANYNDFSEYMLILQKNFNQLSSNVAIDEETRPFDVPRKGIMNEVHYDEYMIFSTKKYMKNNSFLKTVDWINQYYNNLIGNSTNYKPTSVIFTSYHGANQTPINVYAALQCFSLGNSLCFNFKFTDNVLAGSKVSSGNTETPIKYTNDDGVFSNFSFRFIKDNKIPYGITFDKFDDGTNTRSLFKKKRSISESYPLVQDDALERLNEFPEDVIIETPKFNYYKDASSIFGMTYQIHCVPAKNENENIVIGNSFCSNNPLIVDSIYLKRLYVYTGVSESKPLDNKRCLGIRNEEYKIKFTTTESGYIEIIIVDLLGYESGLAHFELGDEEGNLYLRVIGTKKIYISFRNKRDF